MIIKILVKYNLIFLSFLESFLSLFYSHCQPFVCVSFLNIISLSVVSFFKKPTWRSLLHDTKFVIYLSVVVILKNYTFLNEVICNDFDDSSIYILLFKSRLRQSRTSFQRIKSFSFCFLQSILTYSTFRRRLFPRAYSRTESEFHQLQPT